MSPEGRGVRGGEAGLVLSHSSVVKVLRPPRLPQPARPIAGRIVTNDIRICRPMRGAPPPTIDVFPARDTRSSFFQDSACVAPCQAA
jgi:hypothetical protein